MLPLTDQHDDHTASRPMMKSCDIERSHLQHTKHIAGLLCSDPRTLHPRPLQHHAVPDPGKLLSLYRTTRYLDLV